jgi:hypothetical protein
MHTPPMALETASQSSTFSAPNLYTYSPCYAHMCSYVMHGGVTSSDICLGTRQMYVVMHC